MFVYVCLMFVYVCLMFVYVCFMFVYVCFMFVSGFILWTDLRKGLDSYIYMRISVHQLITESLIILRSPCAVDMML